MTTRSILRKAAVVLLAVVVLGGVDFIQGRTSGLGVGRALALGTVQAVGWGLLAPGARALGRRFPVGRGARPVAFLVHGVFATAFALVKSAVDVGIAQAFVAGVPPAGPGFAGNALVYLLLAAGAARPPAEAPPAAAP